MTFFLAGEDAQINRQILLEAYQRGLAWKPNFPNLHNLDRARILKMDGTERDAKDLITALQESDANILPLALHFNEDQNLTDGDLNESTLALVNLRRCPLPDFPPPPHASFHYDDPELQMAVQTMQESALQGEGGWPSCDPDQPDFHSLRVGLDTTRAPANWRAHRDEILAECVHCAGEMGVAVKYILDEPDADVEEKVQFESIPGNVIGYNYFPNPNTCNQVITGRLDIGYDPSDWRLHANLDTHEHLGHGLGLQHTRGGIMNPSILLIWPLSWINDPSEAAMRRMYGGVPVTPGIPPTEIRPVCTGSVFTERTAIGKIAIRGGFGIVIEENQKPGTYLKTFKLKDDGQYEIVDRVEV